MNTRSIIKGRPDLLWQARRAQHSISTKSTAITMENSSRMRQTTSKVFRIRRGSAREGIRKHMFPAHLEISAHQTRHSCFHHPICLPNKTTAGSRIHLPAQAHHPSVRALLEVRQERVSWIPSSEPRQETTSTRHIPSAMSISTESLQETGPRSDREVFEELVVRRR